MRRPVFKATIVGSENVQKAGTIRSPDSFRIRIYDDGEAVITTRGKLAWSGADSPTFVGTKMMGDKYSLEAIVERLSELAGESRQAMKTTKTKRRAGSR